MPPTSRASRCPSAAHGSNQDALTRLYDVRLSAMNNPASRYGSTVKRAMDSLAKCKTHVTTRKEAMELKYVGAALAKIIVLAPPVVTNSSNSKSDTSANSTNTSRSTTNNSIASKRKRPTTLGSGPTTITTQQPQPIKPQISAKQIAYDKAVAHAQSLQFPDNAKWKVILLIDGREQKADHVQAKLQMSGLPCEQRHLPIGDMAWIAQCTTQISSTTNTGGAKNNCIEVMLGTIIERKAVDDLASSLFGTRYLEQRLRLQHSGLTQVLLLVEGNLNSVHNCSGNTLRMAMMETRVHLGFQVVETKHLDDTVRFLKRIHRRLLQRTFPEAFGGDVETSLPSFQSPDAARRRRHRRKTAKVSLADMVMDTSPRPPQGPKTCIDSNNNNRFMTYAELKAKIERDREAGTKTLGAIHKAMLKQIPTFSHKKVSAIGFAYPTPCALMKAYIGLNQEDGKTLVQDLSTNHGSQRTCRIGPKSAAELYTMCTAGACSNDDHHYDNNDTVLNDDYACGLVSEGIPTVHANVTTKSANTPTRSNVDASSCAIATTQQAIEGTTLKRSPHYASMPNNKPSTANTPVRTSPSVSPHPSGFSPSSSYNTTDTLGRVANCVEDPPYFNLEDTMFERGSSQEGGDSTPQCIPFAPTKPSATCSILNQGISLEDGCVDLTQHDDDDDADADADAVTATIKWAKHRRALEESPIRNDTNTVMPKYDKKQVADIYASSSSSPLVRAAIPKEARKLVPSKIAPLDESSSSDEEEPLIIRVQNQLQKSKSVRAENTVDRNCSREEESRNQSYKEVGIDFESSSSSSKILNSDNSDISVASDNTFFVNRDTSALLPLSLSSNCSQKESKPEAAKAVQRAIEIIELD